MFIHYVKIALRNLWKNKTFSIINVLGLSIGIACSLLIIFHVKDELSYDKGFSKSERIYRVTQEGMGEDTRHWAATPPPLGPSLNETFPEIQSSVRFHRPYPYQIFSYTPGNGPVKRFEERGGFFADPGVVDVFDLQFSKGNKTSALTEKNAVVLSEKMAQKYFGTEDPIGKVLQEDGAKVPLKVTGVVKAFSFSSHLQFDYLLSMSTIDAYLDQASLQRLTWSGFYTYVLLKDPSAKKTVDAKLSQFMLKFYAPTGETPKEILSKRRLHLQPIESIHLYSKLEKEMYPNSDITYVYIFSIAALFILMVATVNFVNMSTAHAFKRMKEIGVRKVIGANKRQLIIQFLGESFLMTLLATAFSLFLFRSILPFYNDIASKHFQFEEIFQVSNLMLLLALITLIGLLAGLYPAWFIASFNSIGSLKAKKLSVGSAVSSVRKGLVVFQFVVAVFMIFSTLIIYKQLKLFHQKDLGFDKEQLLAITMYGPMWEQYGSLMNEMKANPSIRSFATVSTLPGERFSTQPFKPLSAKENSEESSARAMWTDDKWITALGVTLKKGRGFVPQFPDIKKNEFILNEAAVKAFGLNDPIGKRFVFDIDTGEVVGVVKDFNFASLHAKVDPLVVQYNPYHSNYLLLKVQGDHIPQVLQFMESKLKALAPTTVFTYSFVDDQLNRLYAAENRMSQIFKAFALFAIFISCLGLFGLSAYAAELRTKEIGIRKVLGATVTNVTVLLSKGFIKLVLVGVIVALPLAWWAMSVWLESFAYRTEIHPWIFALSGVLAVTVAFITVSIQAIKAALSNPVKSLRTE